MTTLAGDSLPYRTGNAGIAFALYIAGIPFYDDREPFVNIYDAKILQRLGYGGRIEEAAELAFARGERGHVEYGFKMAPHLGEALGFYVETQTALEREGADAGGIVSEIFRRHAGGQISLTMALAGATCAIVKRWRAELPAWEASADYTRRKKDNAAKDYDARKLAERIFATGSFFAFAAVIMDARKAFLNLYRKVPPTIRLHRSGQRRQEGERHKLPGFVLYSTNIQNETRKDLGVPTL